MVNHARRARRDPRSLLELRRLAYRVPRDPAAREVLHDALLETFPIPYERAIKEAIASAVSETWITGERFVLFVPSRLHQTHRRQHPASWSQSAHHFLNIASAVDVGFTKRTSTRAIETYLQSIGLSRLKTAVIVYRTRGYL